MRVRKKILIISVRLWTYIQIVAWKVSRNPDSLLAIQTLEEAWIKRVKAVSILFHTYRGSQYTFQAFRRAIEEKIFVQSFSNSSCPYDNPVAESFFKFLKKEELYRRNFYDLDDLKRLLFSHIDGFYNTRR